jgi:general secretion pathway protein C
MTFSPQYLVAANLLLLALIAYSASSIVGTIIAGRLTPAPRVDIAPPPEPIANEPAKPATYYKVISSRDIFHSVQESVPTPAPPPEAPPPDLTLSGVAVHDDAAGSHCIIEDKKTRKQSAYSTGDKIEGTDLKVKTIEWKRVILDRAGQELVLEIQDSAASPAAAGPAAGSRAALASPPTADANIQQLDDSHFVIARSEVDNAMENMSQLFTQVRAVPHFEGGKSIGFRLFAIRRGSLFDKIGLKNGDILKKINQIELNDPSRALSLMQELRNESELTVDIVRNRQPQTLSYRFQ